ncbi:MAG TPA: class F sortase [Streptosporangiaceae bacterium]
MHDRFPRTTLRRSGRCWVIVAVAGSVIAAAGAFLITHALLARSPGLPAGALVIPANIGTAAPTPAAPPAAAPLAASVPTRIEIPSLGVSAPMMTLGLGDNGAVQVPPLENHNLAGWYQGSVTPGERGTSVILGHVDSYTGESVFFGLKTLRAGNRVEVVRADGSTAVFAVDGAQKVVKSTFPAQTIYANTTYPSLRLITCGGPFDKADGQYLDNIVVYAHLIA